MTIRLNMLLLLVAAIITSCGTRDGKPEQQAEITSTEKFMHNMSRFCGQTLTGEIFIDSEEAGINGEVVTFAFENCKDDEVRINVQIPSRYRKTIILTMLNNEILLKHDVRDEDLSPAALTMYGGFSCKDGNENAQVFPMHNFGQNMWPELENHSWEICINEDEAILEYMELAEDEVIKHYIMRFSGNH
jgi:hypothetical protein